MENEQSKCHETAGTCGENCRCNCAPGECKCDAGEACEACESSCKSA